MLFLAGMLLFWFEQFLSIYFKLVPSQLRLSQEKSAFKLVQKLFGKVV